MKRILWIIIFLAALSAGWIALSRTVLERNNKTVELVYDLRALKEVQKYHQLDLEILLGALQKVGIQSLGIEAESLGQWLWEQKSLPAEIRAQILQKPQDLALYLDYPLAFNRLDLELAEQAGLQIVPKLRPAPWAVEAVWLDYKPGLVVLSGPGEIETGQFPRSGMRLGLVEFAEPQLPKGGEWAADSVRVHGISPAELQVLSEERILNRYVRAVKERNIRVLYLRPFWGEEGDWERSLQFLDALRGRLAKAGFVLGEAVPFPDWSPPWPLTILVWAGVFSGAVLFLGTWLPRFFPFFCVAGVVGWLASLGAGVFCFSLTQQALALAAAVVFPSLALQVKKGGPAWGRFLCISGVSCLGALLVVGCLTGTTYLVKLEQFRGVKLMHIAPVFLALLAVVRPLPKWLNKDVPVKYLALGGALGLVGFLYLKRTGNFGAPVFRGEIAAREFLEKLLGVRPRTKEILLGHPALYFLVRQEGKENSWWLPLAVVGQLSLVNTFTHVYTPLKLSLGRTLYGLGFGYLIGWIVFQGYLWGRRWFQNDRGFRVLRIRQPR